MPSKYILRFSQRKWTKGSRAKSWSFRRTRPRNTSSPGNSIPFWQRLILPSKTKQIMVTTMYTSIFGRQRSLILMLQRSRSVEIALARSKRQDQKNKEGRRASYRDQSRTWHPDPDHHCRQGEIWRQVGVSPATQPSAPPSAGPRQRFAAGQIWGDGEGGKSGLTVERKGRVPEVGKEN